MAGRKGYGMSEIIGVTNLVPREGISIDNETLAHLRGVGNPQVVNRALGEALEDLALAMSRAAIAYRDDRFERLDAASRETAHAAALLGLDRLGRVACTVAVLTHSRDSVALAANLSRMIRLGNDALTAIWDLQDRIV